MKDEIVIKKIIGYASKALGYCEGISDRKDFVANTLVVEACVFNLSQIGELTRKLDKPFIDKHPEIPWLAMYGLRNRIIHDYDGVNLDLIWQIIKDDLPALITKLENLQKRP